MDAQTLQVSSQAPTRAQIMRHLTQELPLNDFGLPIGIYRTDMIPFDEYDPTARTPQVPAVVEAPALPHLDLSEAADPSEPEANTSDQQPPPTFDESFFADPISLLAGEGDGLPDPVMDEPKRQRQRGTQERPSSLSLQQPAEYRVAGFPARAIAAAFVPLQYDEGFPAFENGSPFWGRMDFEPSDNFLVFQRYLQLNIGRAADDEDEDDAGEAATGLRTIERLVQQLHSAATDTQILAYIERYSGYYHTYYWGLRAKAYDLFKVVQYKQQQELRAIETQDEHYILARKLRARLAQYFNDDDDFWDMMTPKVAIDMLKNLVQVERISAGLPAGGPQTSHPEGGNQSFELAFRTLAQKQSGDSQKGDTIDQDGDVLDKALEDPAAIEILQELIIKTGGQ